MAFGLPQWRAPSVRLVPIARSLEQGAGKETVATIFLVDADLGFIFWLGQALDSAGYNAIPAASVPAASELIQQHRLSVEILVIDLFLPDSLEFVFRLRQSHPNLQVIAMMPENWGSVPPMIEVDALIRKPLHLTSIAAVQWLNLVQDLYKKSSFVRPVMRSHTLGIS